jgi:hypothetical protein
MDPAQEDFWSDSAGLGRGDNRPDVKGHARIDNRHLPPLSDGARGGAEGHAVHARIPPKEY